MRTPSLIVLAGLLAGCAARPSEVPQVAASGPMPQPTEHRLDGDAERRHKDARKRWFEELHRTGPDVDWRAVERENGAREQARRNAIARARQQGGAVGLAAQVAWSEVGSSNLSGRMHCTAIASDQQTLYAGSALGGLWRGGIDGSNWTPLGDNLYGGVYQLVTIPGELPGDPDVVAVHGGGTTVRVTRDDGAVWETPLGLDGLVDFRNLAKLQASDTILVCGQEPGIGNAAVIRASTDHGRTFTLRWKAASAGKASIWVPRKSAPAVTHVYMAHKGMLKVSTDGGATFTTRGTFDAGAGETWITGSEAGAPTLYVMGKVQNQWRLYRSDDAGWSWAHVHTPSDYWGALCASTINPNVVMYGAVECWRSGNGGASFAKVNGWGEYYSNPAGKLHADIQGLHAFPDPADPATKEIWYVSTDGGVYESKSQGLAPNNLSLLGLGVSQYYSTLTSKNDEALILAGSQDQGYQRGTLVPSSGAGPTTPFQQLISGDYGHLTSSDGGHGLVYSTYPGFILVQEGEQNPNLLYPWLDFPAGSNHSWLPPVVADPLNASVFYFCGDRLTRYTRVSGATWSQALHSSQDFTANGASYLSALAFSPADPQRVYAATNNGRLYSSVDHGVTWSPSVSTAPSQHYFYGTAIAAHPADALEAAVGGSGYSTAGVVRTEDGGATWVPEVDGLPATLVYDLVYAPDGSGDLYAATQAGAWRWRRASDQWENIMGADAPLTLYWSVEAVGGDLIRYGTYGRGIWDYAIPPAVGWTAYGASKVNSLGTAPELGGAGTPSVAVNDFRATLLFGVPGAFGVLIHSDQKASQPFQGGTLHLAPPIARGPTFTFDAFGYAEVPLTVTPALAGTTRFHQAWFRDPLHPDLTATGLSNGLEVRYGP